jgi:xanthine dehydrogenase accessory factor
MWPPQGIRGLDCRFIAMRELVGRLRAWRAEGLGVGRAVLVRAAGSSPRAEGATLLVADDGRLAGSVSGGCVEAAAAQEIAAARADGLARLVRYGISDEDAWSVGLACGGVIDVLVEPEVRAEVLVAAEGREPVAVLVPLPPLGKPTAPGPALVVRPGEVGDGSIELEAAGMLERGSSGIVESGGRSWFVESFPAPPRLVVVGATQTAIPLVRFARDLGFETIVVDGRPAFATAERFAAADRLLVSWPEEAFESIDLGPADAVAVLSHDPKFDDPAVAGALARGCRYVGAIGSRKTQAERRARLAAEGVPDADLARLRGPIGLDLGGRDPAETALAILAEIVAERHGRSGGSLAVSGDQASRGHGAVHDARADAVGPRGASRSP